MDASRIDDIVAAKERVERDWLSRAGVHGVSIGLKRIKGELTDQLAITAHVTQKLPPADLPPEQQIPPEVDGFPTDVIEHPQPEPHVDSSRYRPIPGGCQVAGGPGVGTLGWFGHPIPGQTTSCLLTNHHVLPTVGADVGQPTTDKRDKIGTVSVSVLSSTVDAALATLLPDAGWDFSIIGIGTVRQPRTITLGDLPVPVRKSGRTSGVTSGQITNIAYSGQRTDGWQFTNQQLIQAGGTMGLPFSIPGDSGSVVLDTSNRLVGLLWGGTPWRLFPPTQQYSMASPINLVMAQTGYSPWFAAGAAGAPIADTAHFRTYAQELLGESETGRQMLEFWTRNGDELTRLVHHDRKVRTVWNGSHGDDLLRIAMNNLQNTRGTFPAEIEGVSTLKLLDDIAAILGEQGGDPVREAVQSFRRLLEPAPGRTLEDLLR